MIDVEGPDEEWLSYVPPIPPEPRRVHIAMDIPADVAAWLKRKGKRSQVITAIVRRIMAAERRKAGYIA